MQKLYILKQLNKVKKLEYYYLNLRVIKKLCIKCCIVMILLYQKLNCLFINKYLFYNYEIA